MLYSTGVVLLQPLSLVISTIPEEQLPQQLLPTLLAAIALSSLLISATTYALGAWQSTKLVQFIPITVMRGFLACVGMEIMKVAIENATGGHVDNLGLLWDARFWCWLAPAMACGVLLYVLKVRHVVPAGVLFSAFLVVPITLFVLILWATDTSLPQARELGWMPIELAPGAYFEHWTSFDYWYPRPLLTAASAWWMAWRLQHVRLHWRT